MPGLQPGWTRKNIEHLPRLYLHFKKLSMLYIPEALRHTIMPGLQPWWTRKDVQHFPRFLSAFQKNYSCYISQKHSGIQSCQDFNLDEPEKIYNIFLDIYLHFKKLSMLYVLEALRHTVMPGLQPGWTRKDIEHFPRYLSAFQKTVHVIYPRSTQVYSHARTLTWMNQKEYRTFA